MKSQAKRRVLFPTLLAVIGLALCAIAGAAPGADAGKTTDNRAVQVPANSDTYMLGPEDVLTIYVRNVPEMSGEYLIQLDGTIYFPIVGQVKASGMSAKDLKAYLEKGLGKELKEPEVTVNIKQLRPNRIYIYGSVSHPGVFDYRKGWRLTELIASAGGLALPPERVSAIVFRPGAANAKVALRKVFIDADDAADLDVQPGDSVNIQTDASVRINVVGEAKNPGIHELYEGQGAVEALASGGGETDRAALSRATIMRGKQVIPVNLYAAVIDGDSTKNVVMQDNDTLLIPQQYAKIAVSGNVTRPGSQLLPDGREFTLRDAVAEAGGAAPHAKLNRIQLVRVGPDGKAKTTNYNFNQLGLKVPDPALQDKDIVFIPQSGAPNLGDFSGFANLFWVMRTLTGL